MRSLLFCAALVCAAAPLASQQMDQLGGATWAGVMSYSRPAELPAYVARDLQNTCARAFPDSVVLATPTATLVRGTLSMHTGRKREVFGWEIVAPPTDADSLRVQVVGVACYRTSQNDPWDPMLVLRHGDHYLRYSTPLRCPVSGPCEDFPLVRGMDADSATTLMWDEQGQRVIGVGAFEAERVARIRGYGWPAQMTQAVLDRRVRVGMTSDMVREAWGDPQRINRTELASGTREQWVYGTDLFVNVYVENGRVVSIQDR